MNKFLEWFTLKKLLVFSLVGTIGFSILVPRKVFYAIYDSRCFLCIDIAQYAVLLFLVGVTILIPIIIMSFVKRQHMFETWKKTLFVYLFVYLLNIIFMPWYWGDEFFNFEKDIIAFGISIAYFVFSLILIIYKSLSKESK
ncbi:MAG: hypothetical protein PHT16_00220 [Candidatus Pacebacteria bacterium]|nr:hypothetical protein [Candidatus Paceibacterota bacterium]